MSQGASNNRRGSWMKFLGWSIVAMVVATICVGGWMAYVGISVSLQAESNLHSTIFVIRLVEQFVSEHYRWPRSWDELETLSVSSDGPSPMNGKLSVIRIGGQHGYEWPAASAELQKRVSIDFTADPLLLMHENAMAFTAIMPIGPYYEYRDYGFVQSLQETIRTAMAPVEGE